MTILNLVIPAGFIYAVNSFYFTTRFMSTSQTNMKKSMQPMLMTNIDEEADEESSNFVKRIKSNYLINKFKDCRNEENCRSSCSLPEVELLLRSVLPPVSNLELKDEINALLSTISPQSIKSNSIDVNEFLNAVRISIITL